MSERIAARAAHYGMTRRDGFAMSLPGSRTAIVNMTHIETPLDPRERVVRHDHDRHVRALRSVQSRFTFVTHVCEFPD